MTFAVPANQTVSYSVYRQAIANALPVTNDFLKAHTARIQQAFEMGEPLWMIVDELKLRAEMESVRRTKTPRQLALRVVRV
jgi:hypothetical protein